MPEAALYWQRLQSIACGMFTVQPGMAAIVLQMQIFLLSEALLSIILLAQTFTMCIYAFYAHSWRVNYLYCAVNVKVAETETSMSTLNLQKLIRFFFWLLFTPQNRGTKALKQNHSLFTSRVTA